MKYVPLYLAVVLLLCLAPMPYGYFTLVRILATVVFGLYAYRCYMAKNGGVYAINISVLLPQRFVLPTSGEPHCSRIYDGIFLKQCFDVCCKGVGRVNGTQPISDVAEMGVQFVEGTEKVPLGTF